jgi:hypothetical protein
MDKYIDAESATGRISWQVAAHNAIANNSVLDQDDINNMKIGFRQLFVEPESYLVSL